MSKYVKNLISDDLAKRLDGVTDALLVNVIGLDANSTMTLRRELRAKDIHLLVVKNSLVRRATEGTQIAAAFGDAEVEVGFCCKNCKGAANGKEGDDRLEMLFGKKAFGKAFEVAKSEKKE